MIANVENTVRWLQLNGLKYFVVQLKDADNSRVFESDDSKTFDDNISLFRQVMDVSVGTRYIIKGADSKDSKRGKFLEEFKNVSDALPAVSGLQTNPQPTINNDDIEKIVEKRIKEYEDQKILQELIAENKELKQEVNRRQSVSEQFMERSLPYVGTLGQFLLNKIIPAPAHVAMAGIEKTSESMEAENETPEIELTDEQSERVEKALQKFGKADPDFISLLEKIADMAASGDSTYKMAKSMLLIK